MFQVLNHALGDPNNKTKFTLIFANVTPKDILLKDEFDALKAKHPDTLNIIYAVDKPDDSWKGTVGYVNKTLVQQHIPPPSLAEKVKIFVCGPPGQVNAIAGKKDGMKQGPVGGLLKELGYSEDQVRAFSPDVCVITEMFVTGLQVLDVECERYHCCILVIIIIDDDFNYVRGYCHLTLAPPSGSQHKCRDAHTAE